MNKTSGFFAMALDMAKNPLAVVIYNLPAEKCEKCSILVRFYTAPQAKSQRDLSLWDLDKKRSMHKIRYLISYMERCKAPEEPALRPADKEP